MSYSPNNKRKAAALRPLSEELQHLGLTMDDMIRDTEGVTPVIGVDTHRFQPKRPAASQRQVLDESKRRVAAKAEAIARKRKAMKEAMRRRKTKLREGVKGTAGNRWLRAYGEAVQGRAPAAPSRSPLKDSVGQIIEDIQDLVSGAAGRMTESTRREYRRAFRNVAEVAELLARRYDRLGSVKGEAVARMLRKMKAEAVGQFHKLSLGEDVPPASDAAAYTPGELPDTTGDDGSGDLGAAPADPDPNIGAGEPLLDLENPSGDIGAGKRPGEPTPVGSEEPTTTKKPTDIRKEEVDLENPSGDIGKGKKPGEPTPTGSEPDWIDPDLRKELKTYVGEEDEDDDDDEEEPEVDEGEPCLTCGKSPCECATEGEEPEEPEELEEPEDTEYLAGEEEEEEDDDLSAMPPSEPLPLPVAPSMGDEEEEEEEEDDELDLSAPPPPPSSPAPGEPQIKEMMKALVAALDGYQKDEEARKLGMRRRR